MKFLKALSIFILLAFLSNISFAQERKKIEGSLNEGTIESQYNYLYKKAPKWTDPNSGTKYKTVKINNLLKFKSNVTDSLKLDRKKLLAEKTIVATQKSEIEALKLKLGETNENLTSVTQEKDSIKFLGMPMSKSGYNSLLWTIIAALTAGLALFITKFKSSNTITVQVKKDKIEIEGEYDEYRRKAIEREQKLRRELQDELNKQKYNESSPQKRK